MRSFTENFLGLIKKKKKSVIFLGTVYSSLQSLVICQKQTLVWNAAWSWYSVYYEDSVLLKPDSYIFKLDSAHRYRLVYQLDFLHHYIQDIYLCWPLFVWTCSAEMIILFSAKVFNAQQIFMTPFMVRKQNTQLCTFSVNQPLQNKWAVGKGEGQFNQWTSWSPRKFLILHRVTCWNMNLKLCFHWTLFNCLQQWCHLNTDM